MVEQGESDCCAICLEAFDSKPKTSNKIFLECGHEFCFTCMIPQMKQKNSCPLCRAKIDKKKGENEIVGWDGRGPVRLSHTAGVGLLDDVIYESDTRSMIKYDIRDMIEKIQFNMKNNIETDWRELENKCTSSVMYDVENLGIRLLHGAKVLERFEDNFDIIAEIEEEEEDIHANHRVRERNIEINREDHDDDLEYERDISDAIRIIFEE
jgi:hypothetical protein